MQIYAVGGVALSSSPSEASDKAKKVKKEYGTPQCFSFVPLEHEYMKRIFCNWYTQYISYQDTLVSFNSSWTTDNIMACDCSPVILATNEECGRIWSPNLEVGAGFGFLILRTGCRLEKDVNLRSLFTVLSHMCLYFHIIPNLEHKFTVIVRLKWYIGK